MDLEDLIKGKKHHKYDHHNQGHHHGQESWYEHHNQHSYHRNSIERYLPYLKQLSGNKKILAAIITLGIICLIVAVIGIIILVPLLMHGFDYIDKNGIKGLFNLSQTIIDRVINGAGK